MAANKIWWNPNISKTATTTDAITILGGIHRGVKLVIYKAQVEGKTVFTGGSKNDCEDYLTRTGFYKINPRLQFALCN